MNNRVHIFDTTLRDGEQSPGVSLNLNEKLQIARQLARLGVDIIEAGFPLTSPGDFAAVQAVAKEIRGITVAGLARANVKDIDCAWEALKGAEQGRIHIFLATSDIHLKYKLRMNREQVIEAAVAAIKHAKKYTSDVEFSAEDASRSDLEYLCKVFGEVIKAGATVINIPDTVGYTTPEEYAKFIRAIIEKTPGMDTVTTSVHCHDDLGLAVANSLAAVGVGARQVEGAINGIGERAGNAALEEVIMGLHTRKDHYGLTTGINTQEIYRTSRLVSSLTGMPVQPNKSVVGKNAFAHESGIHQDGVLKERTTYEIMNPEQVGIIANNLVLGKHSGRHAFKERLSELGYSLNEEELNLAFSRFKVLADKKKEIADQDLQAIVEDEIKHIPDTYVLEYLHISTGTSVVPTATLGLRVGEELKEEAACGDGPVDAIYKTVDKITGFSCTLVNYALNAITGGKDALGDVTVKLQCEGNEKTYTGRGLSTDILEASAKAYVNAVNKLIYDQK
ncbi:2-isopropylmalate synthase [Desulfotomaculum sp. 1211_IL3151]|uniref:2-isopropylmalate synthase n=1 Tax=Desulfotomaculum sp. 1211_IL3151 TaxID=3084055 RepID=UPI002FD9ACFC